MEVEQKRLWWNSCSFLRSVTGPKMPEPPFARAVCEPHLHQIGPDWKLLECAWTDAIRNLSFFWRSIFVSFCVWGHVWSRLSSAHLGFHCSAQVNEAKNGWLIVRTLTQVCSGGNPRSVTQATKDSAFCIWVLFWQLGSYILMESPLSRASVWGHGSKANILLQNQLCNSLDTRQFHSRPLDVWSKHTL